MAKLKWGVIGVGMISDSHINTIRDYCDNTELYAICDIDRAWVEFAKDKYGAKKAYIDYHDLISDPEIDVVSVTVPNNLHAKISIDALEAGKHVLCEKPMAPTATQGRLMAQAAKKTGKRLMIGQNQRFCRPAQYMKRLYDEGRFGDVYHIRTGWIRPLGMMPSVEDKRSNGATVNRNWYNDKSMDGGVLRDLGVHMIDLAMFITGFPKMTDATASLYRKFEPDVSDDVKAKNSFTSEDMASAIVKFDNGMSLDLEVSFGSPMAEEKIFTNIYGTRMGAERLDEELTLINCEDGISFTAEKANIRETTRHFEHCVDEFANAIVNDKETPVTPESAIAVLEILDRIYESSGFLK
ncbi:MAG: Gfo/Idh/MocA family oxidoreductase [Clostridia bacterium]|nr:Gfo/Idh/MocA family oxidoreductase [Clostridia bacterium]